MSSSSRPLNGFLLTMICISTILGIRNWPLNAEYGLSSLTLLLIAGILFLIPTSLVSAELATGWPKNGGIYVWVKEAFGQKWGFAAAWFVWISNVVWYPTILSFVAASVAYSFFPEYSSSPAFLFSIILTSFWSVLLINLRGMKASGWFSSLCLILGTILPGLLIIGLSFLWVGKGLPVQIDLSMKEIIPKFSGFNQIVFFTGLLLGFAGMEMPAVHANDVINPQRNYPRAIFVSALIIIALSILGALALGIVIPKSQINLLTAPLEVIKQLFAQFGLSFFTPLVCLLIGIGALGCVGTWIVGPSRGLLVASKESQLPKVLHQVNKKNMPISILLLNGIIVSVLALVFFIMPNISSSFWVLTVLASQLYLVAYCMLFMAGIALRYKKKDVKRTYRVSKGNLGMWVVGGVGLVNAFFAIVIGFLPPEQLEVGNKLVYFSLLFGFLILFVLPPLLIRKREERKVIGEKLASQ